MDYEKAYIEALERARKIHNETEFDYEKGMMEEIFPELQESEDEKNVKDLIDELKCSLRAANCQNEACNGGHEKRIALLEWAIAWVEKQSKSSPVLSNSLNIGKREIDENNGKISELYEHIRNTCACIDDALSSESVVDIKDYLEQASDDAYKAFEWIEKMYGNPREIRDICVIENMLDKYKKIYYGNKNINKGEDIENEDDDIDTENKDKMYKMYNLTLHSIINGLYIVSHGLDNLDDIKGEL